MEKGKEKKNKLLLQGNNSTRGDEGASLSIHRGKRKKSEGWRGGLEEGSQQQGFVT